MTPEHDHLFAQQAPLEHIISLRTRLLRPNFPQGQLATYPADALETTQHFAVINTKDNDRAVACATIQFDPFPKNPDVDALRLRGMAVAPEYRRQGLGQRVLHCAMSTAAISYPEVDIIWCNARHVAIEFYKHMGFHTWGDSFDLPEIGPHVVMWRHLPQMLA